MPVRLPATGEFTDCKPVRAVLLDAFGTLVALEPPAPRLRVELKRTLGVEVGAEAADAAIRAEISFYLEHHLEGADARVAGPAA